MLQTGVCPAGTDVNDCSSSSGASTPLTNANILAAVDACLAEDPINMVCPNTEYGDAADWDVGGVTDFSYALSTFSNRPGGAAASTQFVGGSVFANWDVIGATSFLSSACFFLHVTGTTCLSFSLWHLSLVASPAEAVTAAATAEVVATTIEMVTCRKRMWRGGGVGTQSWQAHA